MARWLISAEELAQALDRVRILDARPGDAGRAAYASCHVRGALHADLDSALAAPVANPAEGGRHPLPDCVRWCAQLGAWGITPEQTVVVYDDQGGANAAARAWWMLRSVGHDDVRVLDGGLQAAVNANVPLDDILPVSTGSPPYPAARWLLPTRAWHEVDAMRLDRTCRVIDVRAAGRYRGEFEPIDPVAGHIPGAINLPFSANLASDGRFKTSAELRLMYQRALPEIALAESASRLVVHCGSGVTACHSILALALAGFDEAALYVGSWSEWCRRDLARAVGTGLNSD